MQVFLRVALIIITLAYPFVFYFGSETWDPWVLGVFLVALASTRILATDSQLGSKTIWLGIMVFLGFVIFGLGRPDGYKLYPILVNLIFLSLFSYSLVFPPTIIEKIARLAEPDLPPSGVIYTRKVTICWICFFIINGSASAISAIWMSDEIWLLYNGLISYLLMGALLTVEFLVRNVVRSKNDQLI